MLTTITAQITCSYEEAKRLIELLRKDGYNVYEQYLCKFDLVAYKPEKNKGGKRERPSSQENP